MLNKGNGLELSITKELVGVNNVKINLDSTSGMCAVFTKKLCDITGLFVLKQEISEDNSVRISNPCIANAILHDPELLFLSEIALPAFGYTMFIVLPFIFGEWCQSLRKCKLKD